MERRTCCFALLFFAAALFLVPAAHAQWTSDPRIGQRMVNQQASINHGVNSGHLTPGEARRLAARQAGIGQTGLMAQADGNLTPGQGAKFTRKQNRDRGSRTIYRVKQIRVLNVH